MRLNRDLIQRMVGATPSASVTGGGTAIDPYVLPVAADGVLGGIQLGYTGTGKYYPVQLDDQQRAFVNVTWPDHYAWGDITDKPATATRWPSWSEVTSKPSATGGSTTPVYWNGSGFTTCTPYSQASVNYATSAGNADTVDNYHASGLWRSDGGTWNPQANIEMHANANGCEWSFDMHRGNYTGCIWHVWDEANGSILVVDGATARVGIGTTSPSYKLHVAGKIYCTGGFAFLSDIRKKNVVGFCNGFSVKDIANAPLIQYTLKGDLDDGRRHVGSVAQYWQKVLPDTVNEADDTLSMDQESILMASVITLARKVMSLENQIFQLKVKGYGKQ